MEQTWANNANRVRSDATLVHKMHDDKHHKALLRELLAKPNCKAVTALQKKVSSNARRQRCCYVFNLSQDKCFCAVSALFPRAERVESAKQDEHACGFREPANSPRPLFCLVGTSKHSTWVMSLLMFSDMLLSATICVNKTKWFPLCAKPPPGWMDVFNFCITSILKAMRSKRRFRLLNWYHHYCC